MRVRGNPGATGERSHARPPDWGGGGTGGNPLTGGRAPEPLGGSGDAAVQNQMLRCGVRSEANRRSASEIERGAVSVIRAARASTDGRTPPR